jgi:hypothetical protein
MVPPELRRNRASHDESGTSGGDDPGLTEEGLRVQSVVYFQHQRRRFPRRLKATVPSPDSYGRRNG